MSNPQTTRYAFSYLNLYHLNLSNNALNLSVKNSYITVSQRHWISLSVNAPLRTRDTIALEREQITSKSLLES